MPPCPGQRPRARTQVTADLFTLFLTARSAVGDTVALCSAMLWGINYVRISWRLFPVYPPDHQHASSAPGLASALPGWCPSVANRAQERTAPRKRYHSLSSLIFPNREARGAARG